MSKIISILGAITIYVGTIDRVTNGVATIELMDTGTYEVTEIELPVKAIPCRAIEGTELSFTSHDGAIYIECMGCE